MRNRILVACVGVPVILVVLFVLPEAFTPALIAVLSVIGTYEALHAIGMNHPRIALYTALVALAIPFWVYFGEPRQWGLLVLLVYLVLVFAEAFASRLRVKIDRVGAGFFFAFIISYCLSSVVRVGNLELRDSYVFLPILLPFVVDAGAMFVGMFLGKHPFAPVLSPKKTVEGSVGGLIVGVGIGENYFASDVTALVAYTKNVIYLEDGEIADITPESVTVYDSLGKAQEKTVTRIAWDIAAAEKGGYDHFMLKEIMEQPNAIKSTIEPRIKDGEVVLDDFSLTDEELKNINKIMITACGSAYYAGSVGKYVIEDLCRIPVEADLASELRYRNPLVDEHTLLVVVS